MNHVDQSQGLKSARTTDTTTRVGDIMKASVLRTAALKIARRTTGAKVRSIYYVYKTSLKSLQQLSKNTLTILQEVSNKQFYEIPI